jgi:Short C-terminal domain
MVKLNYILIAIALAGCGEVRTEPPGSNHADGAVGTGADTLRSPTYDADLESVHAAALRACLSYFQHVDTDAPDKKSIQVIDWCFWGGGTTETTITLSPLEPRTTLVSVESHAGSPSGVLAWNGSREEQVIRNFLSHLDIEMKLSGKAPDTGERLRNLENLHDQKLITDDEYRAKRAEILNGL